MPILPVQSFLLAAMIDEEFFTGNILSHYILFPSPRMGMWRASILYDLLESFPAVQKSRNGVVIDHFLDGGNGLYFELRQIFLIIEALFDECLSIDGMCDSNRFWDLEAT